VGRFAANAESGTLPRMLFMVIESFKDRKLIGERFERHGRMLPEGVTYHTSWVDSAGNRCFQVMEAADRAALTGWAGRWDDLIDFEIVPVLASRDFWSKWRDPNRCSASVWKSRPTKSIS
jgi:hypothetical protein